MLKSPIQQKAPVYNSLSLNRYVRLFGLIWFYQKKTFKSLSKIFILLKFSCYLYSSLSLFSSLLFLAPICPFSQPLSPFFVVSLSLLSSLSLLYLSPSPFFLAPVFFLLSLSPFILAPFSFFLSPSLLFYLASLYFFLSLSLFFLAFISFFLASLAFLAFLSRFHNLSPSLLFVF